MKGLRHFGDIEDAKILQVNTISINTLYLSFLKYVQIKIKRASPPLNWLIIGLLV